MQAPLYGGLIPFVLYTVKCALKALHIPWLWLSQSQHTGMSIVGLILYMASIQNENKGIKSKESLLSKMLKQFSLKHGSLTVILRSNLNQGKMLIHQWWNQLEWTCFKKLRVNHGMFHRFPLETSESQFEFGCTNGTDDRTHFKLIKLNKWICSDVDPCSCARGVLQWPLDGIFRKPPDRIFAATFLLRCL